MRLRHRRQSDSIDAAHIEGNQGHQNGWLKQWLIQKRSWLTAAPSWLASLLLNLSLILLLATGWMTSERITTISLDATDIETTNIDEAEFSLDSDEGMDAELEDEMSELSPELALSEDELMVETDLVFDSGELLANELAPLVDTSSSELTESEMSNETSGRTGEGKDALLKKYGGNAASEEAVDLALQWIADHQCPDGGWNLDHTIGETVNGRPRTSPNPGQKKGARMGATALALLPMLGAGNTHESGRYKDVVFNGIKFLMERPNLSAKGQGVGISYWDEGGTMYSHGLVAIVFNELYAMTADQKLRVFAQGTIAFIEDWQDPVGGGWRYNRRQLGDTSAVGWQLMALKSARMSGLETDPRTLKLVKNFLHVVSTDNGAFYGYLEKAKTTKNGDLNRRHRATTAIGLLSRMYLGWEREHKGISLGLATIAKDGPDVDPDHAVSVYYNYYATQAMKHYGGELWPAWNEAMRDFLLETQANQGPAKGSWLFNPNGEYQKQGGRLYTTSLSCMTLEVYYRYLPLYNQAAIDSKFITE